jgi:hypothetical protein
VLGKAVQRFFFTKNKAVKDDPNVYLELHFWCNTKLKSRLNLRLLPCFKFFLMVKGHESGGERVHPPHPPAFGIWQSIINPNSFIHPFHKKLVQFLMQTFPMCLWNSKFKFAF